jgi:hypothetical protein
MPKSKPTAKTTAKTTSAAKPAAKPAAKAATDTTADAAAQQPARGATARSAKAAKAAKPRGKAQPRTPRFSDSEIDITPVRIVDDRRFSGKFQIVEDEGEKRVLGWGFPSVQAARRWIENRNHLSAWLRFILRGE